MNNSTFFDVELERAAEPPSNLDTHIKSEHQALEAGPVGFRWYRGADAQGVTRVFRFQRGGSIEQWRQGLRSQRLIAVSGPFRAQNQALNATAIAA